MTPVCVMNTKGESTSSYMNSKPIVQSQDQQEGGSWSIKL